jgi:hypothetical protein
VPSSLEADIDLASCFFTPGALALEQVAALRS